MRPLCYLALLASSSGISIVQRRVGNAVHIAVYDHDLAINATLSRHSALFHPSYREISIVGDEHVVTRDRPRDSHYRGAVRPGVPRKFGAARRHGPRADRHCDVTAHPRRSRALSTEDPRPAARPRRSSAAARKHDLRGAFERQDLCNRRDPGGVPNAPSKFWPNSTTAPSEAPSRAALEERSAADDPRRRRGGAATGVSRESSASRKEIAADAGRRPPLDARRARAGRPDRRGRLAERPLRPRRGRG